jgi:UDPglucose 6-dehydrogenase
MKIAVIGTGYVGLVSGTCFAETGNDVICVDINEEKVKSMQNGNIPIYEPGLETLFHRNIEKNRLLFTTNLKEAVDKSDIIFLALPTPPGEDGSADLSYIIGVAEQLGKIMTSYKVIVDKSTVPVGTADKVKDAILKNSTCEFDVVSNPEFLREGVAVEDFLKPDRVVIGSSSDRAKQMMNQLYEPFVRQGNPIIHMDLKSAEMTKYAANAFLATKISFMNEIANLCELTGADADMVRKGIGTDNRIGNRFLFPGVGYGGSCFPKDVHALARTSKENEYDFKILEAVMSVNDRQREMFFNKIKNRITNLKEKNIALWGLAFKPNTDDIREAPALYIIDQLLLHGANITAYDPEAMNNVKKIYGDKIKFADTEYDALKGADFLVIVTEWSEFRNPNFDIIKSELKDHLIFDGRNVFSLSEMKKQGFEYISIGREVINQ